MIRRINLRFPGGLIKAFTTSYDDGVEQDIRLIEIMRKNGIKGTFNISSGLYAEEGHVYPEGQVHRRMSKSQCLQLYRGKDIEVAVHGYVHPFWTMLPTSDCVADVIDDRRALERDYGCFVRGAAYPYGAYNDDVVDILDKCGIVYCRATESTHGFGIPKKPLVLQPTCHHNDPMLNELIDKFLAANDAREPLLFYLWGHSYEFEGNDNWNVIEDALARLGHRSDIWYATNIEIANYVSAFKHLIYSADADTIYNPTDVNIWISDGSETYVIGSGETMKI